MMVLVMKNVLLLGIGNVIKHILLLRNAIYLRKEERMFEDNFHQEQTKELAKALRIAMFYLDWNALEKTRITKHKQYILDWWDRIYTYGKE